MSQAMLVGLSGQICSTSIWETDSMPNTKHSLRRLAIDNTPRFAKLCVPLRESRMSPKYSLPTKLTYTN
jgi:hypothetical protein